MTIAYSCPSCRKILGSDTDIIAPACPGCGTKFDPAHLRSSRRRDRWMHIIQLTVCAGVGGASLAMILAAKYAAESPRMGKIILAGLVLGLVGGFFGLRRYDERRNGPM